MNFSRFCTPAQLYLILAGISLITAFFNDFRVITLVANGIFVLIWGWILNWLCSKGLKAISWILVLLPFIFFIFTFFLAKDIMSNAADEEGDQEGFQEGYQDCVKYLDGTRCKSYPTQKEADDAKKAREKAEKEAKLAKEQPNRAKEDAERRAYEQKMADAEKKREAAEKAAAAAKKK